MIKNRANILKAGYLLFLCEKRKEADDHDAEDAAYDGAEAGDDTDHDGRAREHDEGVFAEGPAGESAEIMGDSLPPPSAEGASEDDVHAEGDDYAEKTAAYCADIETLLHQPQGHEDTKLIE